jgi:hypothetical protein
MYAAASGGPGPEHIDPNGHNGSDEAVNEPGDDAPIDADFDFVGDEKNS